MPGHIPSPPRLVAAPPADQAPVSRAEYERVWRLLSLTEREVRNLRTQRNVLASVVRCILDGELGQAADLIRQAVDELGAEIVTLTSDTDPGDAPRPV